MFPNDIDGGLPGRLGQRSRVMQMPDAPAHLGPCWRAMTGRADGYYQITKFTDDTVRGYFDGDKAWIYVHRWALEVKLGRQIRPDYESDHLCFTRDCFRPDHLEEVTLAENRQRRRGRRPGPTKQRGETCRHGHPWTLYGKINTQGMMICTECAKEAARRYAAKRNRAA